MAPREFSARRVRCRGALHRRDRRPSRCRAQVLGGGGGGRTDKVRSVHFRPSQRPRDRAARNTQQLQGEGLERETGFEPATLSLGKIESGIAGGHKASQAIVTTRSANDAPFQPPPPQAAIRRDFASPLLPDFSASLTVKEVSASLRVCTATVYRLCTTGELPHFRVGASIRILEKDLSRFHPLRTPNEPR